MPKINVLNRDVTIYEQDKDDYICITDIAKYKNPDHTNDLIRNWLRNRNTIEFLGIWEQLNNPDFKPVEFDGFSPFRETEQLNLKKAHVEVTLD
jgi:hypothetical protein